MTGDSKLAINDVTALWDGVELLLNFTAESLHAFALAIAQQAITFSIEPGFGSWEMKTLVSTKSAVGFVKIEVKNNSINISGDSDALRQMARNLSNLPDMAVTTGVSHMHFDPVADSDLMDAESAALVACLDLKTFGRNG